MILLILLRRLLSDFQIENERGGANGSDFDECPSVKKPQTD